MWAPPGVSNPGPSKLIKMMLKTLQLLSWTYLAAQSLAVDPVAVYDGDGAAKGAAVALRIGNGGAGQSGLVGGRNFPVVPLAC